METELGGEGEEDGVLITSMSSRYNEMNELLATAGNGGSGRIWPQQWLNWSTARPLVSLVILMLILCWWVIPHAIQLLLAFCIKQLCRKLENKNPGKTTSRLNREDNYASRVDNTTAAGEVRPTFIDRLGPSQPSISVGTVPWYRLFSGWRGVEVRLQDGAMIKISSLGVSLRHRRASSTEPHKLFVLWFSGVRVVLPAASGYPLLPASPLAEGVGGHQAVITKEQSPGAVTERGRDFNPRHDVGTREPRAATGEEPRPGTAPANQTARTPPANKTGHAGLLLLNQIKIWCLTLVAVEIEDVIITEQDLEILGSCDPDDAQADNRLGANGTRVSRFVELSGFRIACFMSPSATSPTSIQV